MTMIWMVSFRVSPLTVQEAVTMKLERLFLMVTTPFSLMVAMVGSETLQVTAGLETAAEPLNATTPSAMVSLTSVFFLKTSSFSSPPSVIFR